jgi:hypothetical protein
MEWIQQGDMLVLCELVYQNGHIVEYNPIAGMKPKYDLQRYCEAILQEVTLNYSFYNDNYSNPILC